MKTIVGSTVGPGPFTGTAAKWSVTGDTLRAQQFDACVNRVAAMAMQKVYLQQDSSGNGVYPAAINASMDGTASPIYLMQKKGGAVLISVKPSQTQTASERTKLNNFLALLAGTGYFNSTNCFITLWQECNNSTAFASGAAYLSYVSYYWTATAKSYGFKLFYNPLTGFKSEASVLSYYQTGLFDGICADYYAMGYASRNAGTGYSDIAYLVTQANTDGIMFGLAEFNENGSHGGAAVSQATWNSFISFLIQQCQAATHGCPFALCYNGFTTEPNDFVPTMQTSYSKVPGFQKLYDALTKSTGGGGSSDTSVYASAYTDAYNGATITAGGGTPGFQPIAAGPYLINSAGISSGTALPVSVASNTGDGDNIVVGVTVNTASVTPSVTDTQGNSYTATGSDTTETGAQLWVFEATGTTALLGGTDVITVSLSAASAASAVAVGDPDVGSSAFAIAHGSSTAPTVTVTLPSSQEDNCIAFIADTTTGGNPTWGTGWDLLVNQADGGSHVILSAAVFQPTSNTSATPSGTIVSAPWTAAVLGEAITPASLANTISGAVQGIPYSQTLEAAGGVGAITYSVPAGTLPSGLALSSGGVISGTPAAGGTSSFILALTDANGVTTSSNQSITVLASNTALLPAVDMPTNLLSANDSGFATGAGTWAANQNANAPQTNTSIAASGGTSLYWTSAADGATSISTGSYPVQAGKPYILSAFLLTTSNLQPDLFIEIDWFDSLGAPISAQSDQAPSAASLTWTPVAVAATAPSNAATAQVTLVSDASNAGDSTFADLVFLTQTSAQVLVDWVNPPFLPGGIAGSAFMDVSPWLRLDGNGISYTIGRQDAISEIQPGSGSFDLQNDQGQFARDNSTSLPAILGGAVTLQLRAQINLADETGTWQTRFDGNISEIDYAFDSIGGTSIATIALTDILAHLNRQDPLRCWTREQVLADGPLYHWALDDPGTLGGANVAAETSGNNGPGMRLVSSDTSGTATIAWQDTSGGVETLANAASATGSDGSSYWAAGTNQPNSPLRGLVSGHVGPFTTPAGSVMFTPKQTAQSAQNTFIGGTGYQLVAELSSPLAPTATGSDYSIECWFMPDPSLASGLALNNGPYIALGLGSSRTKTNMLAGIWLNAGAAKIECATYSQPPAFLGLNWPGAATPAAVASTSATWTADTAKRPHHMVISIQGDPAAPAVTFWIDGQIIGNGFTLPKGQTYDTICIGGAYGGCGAFYGNISTASVYPFLLSAQQITQHCMLGQYGMWEQTSDDCIALLGQLAGVPAFWSNLAAQHTGLTVAEYLDINGANAIAAMQQYESAERGLLFAGNDGALTFHQRSWRMGYRAPDLLLPQDCFSSQLEFKVVDQFMVNEEGIAGPNTLGATATTLLANPSTGQTQTQTSSSSVIQAGYTNTASQAKYGAYAPNPVSSPLTLPLITWSRGPAALGLPAYSYDPGPNLADRAAWDANSRAEPWALPASVTVDLLTLNPNTGLGISDFYAIGIDNMIAPSPGWLPPSFPNAQTSVEWFIEGVTETYSLNARTIEFYTSPAEPQRAWIPGDATYGVLGSTARLGISAADTATVQADGKDVAHDAGGPYWPPNFSAAMNDTATHGFVGAADMRGIAQNLQTMLQPPLCVAQALNQTQSFASGALTAPQLFWDVVLADTTAGLGAIPGWPNWYLVTQAGFYEIDVNMTWSVGAAGQAGYTGQAWIVVAQAAAQAIAAGTGTPTTVNQYVCPVGEATQFTSTNSINPVCAPATRMYLGVGDMVGVAAEHNYTSAKSSGTGVAGSMLSIRFAGLATADDRTLVNTSLASGGSVSLVSHGAVKQATFLNTHTYAYQGDTGFSPNARRNSDKGCYQGVALGSANQGSQSSQVAFNYSSIVSALSGHTVLSATLTATNVATNYTTGARLMLGWTKDIPGGTSFNPGHGWTTTNVMYQWFTPGQALTFSIPVSIVNAFVTGSAKALVLGDGDITSKGYSGWWAGGPEAWTLTVNYV